jgi:alpha-tubulin suppressor-like RCC1 family protein
MKVACREEHALLLTPEGALYAFGSNGDGRLGIGDRSTPLRSLPTLVPDLVSYPIVGVACGAVHSAAVSAAGDLYTWGQGRHGALESLFWRQISELWPLDMLTLSSLRLVEMSTAQEAIPLDSWAQAIGRVLSGLFSFQA